MKLLNRIPSWGYLMALFVLALVVRLLHITDTDIAGDEPFSIFMAQFNVSEIIGYLNTGNNPPLFEILLHYYMLWVGDSDFLLRLFPTVCSALTIIPIFLVGDKFLNRRVAVAASLLFVFSIYNIRFAHEVRVYALFTLLFSWVMYFFFTAVKKPDNYRIWLMLSVTNAILLYAHYLSVYVLFVQGLTGLFFIPKSKWKYLLAMFVIALMLYSPSLLVFVERFGKVNQGGTWVTAPGWGEIYGSVNLLLNNRVTTVIILFTALAGIRITAKHDFAGRLRAIVTNKFGIMVLLWFAVPYLVMFFVSKFYLPMFIDRYILFISAPLFLGVCWVIDELWSVFKLRGIGLVLVVLASLVTTNLNPSNNREIAAATKQIAELKTAESQVYVSPVHFNLAFAYHYNHELFELRGSKFPTQALDSALKVEGIYFVSGEEELSLHAPRIIYLDAASEFVNPDNGILKALQSSREQKSHYHHHQIFDIYVFE